MAQIAGTIKADRHGTPLPREWIFNNFQKKSILRSLFLLFKKKSNFQMPLTGENRSFEKLPGWFACFVFDKDRGDCFCCYWSPHKNSEFPAVVDVCYLETDNQAEAEACDAY